MSDFPPPDEAQHEFGAVEWNGFNGLEEQSNEEVALGANGLIE